MTAPVIEGINGPVTEPILVTAGSNLDHLASFHAFPEILRRSSYIRTLLDSQRPQYAATTSERTIDFPDDDLRAVQKHTSWLSGRPFVYDDNEVNADLATYIFANRVGDEAYCNDIMDAMVAYYDKKPHFADMKRIRNAYECGLGRTQMGRFLLRSSISHLLFLPQNWVSRPEFFRELYAFRRALPEMVEDLITVVAEFQEVTSMEKINKFRGYKFHTHSQGTNCSRSVDQNPRAQKHMRTNDGSSMQ